MTSNNYGNDFILAGVPCSSLISRSVTVYTIKTENRIRKFRQILFTGFYSWAHILAKSSRKCSISNISNNKKNLHSDALRDLVAFVQF